MFETITIGRIAHVLYGGKVVPAMITEVGAIEGDFIRVTVTAFPPMITPQLIEMLPLFESANEGIEWLESQSNHRQTIGYMPMGKPETLSARQFIETVAGMDKKLAMVLAAKANEPSFD